MAKYKIITRCDSYSSYEVEAKDEAEARNKYYDGEWKKEELLDYKNEDIEEITVIKTKIKT